MSLEHQPRQGSTDMVSKILEEKPLSIPERFGAAYTFILGSGGFTALLFTLKTLYPQMARDDSIATIISNFIEYPQEVRAAGTVVLFLSACAHHLMKVGSAHMYDSNARTSSIFGIVKNNENAFPDPYFDGDRNAKLIMGLMVSVAISPPMAGAMALNYVSGIFDEFKKRRRLKDLQKAIGNR